MPGRVVDGEQDGFLAGRIEQLVFLQYGDLFLAVAGFVGMGQREVQQHQPGGQCGQGFQVAHGRLTRWGLCGSRRTAGSNC
ncbi:hypothetical protein D3C76_1578890 [compost metagenome]